MAVNCLCSTRLCATCWCLDSELADGHHKECQYSKMAEVMEQLDAASDELLDEDNQLLGKPLVTAARLGDVWKSFLHALKQWWLIPP